MCRAEQNGLAYLPSAILLGREVVMLPQLALLIRPLVFRTKKDNGGGAEGDKQEGESESGPGS